MKRSVSKSLLLVFHMILVNSTSSNYRASHSRHTSFFLASICICACEQIAVNGCRGVLTEKNIKNGAAVLRAKTPSLSAVVGQLVMPYQLPDSRRVGVSPCRVLFLDDIFTPQPTAPPLNPSTRNAHTHTLCFVCAPRVHNSECPFFMPNIFGATFSLSLWCWPRFCASL